MKFLKSNLFVFLTCGSFAYVVLAHSLGAHVHGQGTLTIAFDTPTQATINFEIPSESIIGFEHEATSKKDIKTRDDAFKKLKDNVNRFVVFDPALGCQATSPQISLEADHDEDEAHAEGEHSGQHQNLKAEFSVVCQKNVAGSQGHLGFLRQFPRIKKIKVQVLNDNKQTETDVQNDKQDIDF